MANPMAIATNPTPITMTELPPGVALAASAASATLGPVVAVNVSGFVMDIFQIAVFRSSVNNAPGAETNSLGTTNENVTAKMEANWSALMGDCQPGDGKGRPLQLAAGVTLKMVGNLAHDLIGTWRLLSRIDRDESGRPVDEPTLGSDPSALLFFDGAGNFAAQFMKRDRSEAVVAPVFTGQNNTTAIGGYDAYFGTYEVDKTSGEVRTHLVGALSPGHVGATMVRNMKVEERKLVIRLTTSTADDRVVHRTLTWERAG